MPTTGRPQFWLPTAISCIALTVSALSAFISWKSYSINVEDLGFSNNFDFNYDCPLAFGQTLEDDSIRAFVGLCWEVTIANKSGARTSVVDYSSNFPSEGPPPRKGLSTDVLDRQGHTLATPIVVDGGEARIVIVRAGVPITDALWKLIEDAIKRQTDTTKPQTKEPGTLKDIAAIAAQAKLDVLGNPVSVLVQGPAYMIGFPSDYKKRIVTFRLHTGRDNFFETQLMYPTGQALLLGRAH